MIIAGCFCLLLMDFPMLVRSKLTMKRSTRMSFHHSIGLLPQHPLVSNGPFGSKNAGATYHRAVTIVKNDMVFLIYHFDSITFFFLTVYRGI